MTFREIAFGSDDYRRTLELREAVLRKPLGLTLASEDLEAERDQFHFGLFGEDGTLMGSVIAVPVEAEKARLRQMAVAPEFSGQGCGARILQELESELRRRGFRHISLHARATVSGFYEKSGYLVTGPEFEEVSIPHLPMAKAL
jgi:predicted GNAT family N-acyltransferase